MEKKKSTAAPKFGDWEENCHYTTYFEKAARPTTTTPTPPNPNPNQIGGAAATADLIRKRAAADPSSSPVQPRSSAASSQRSTPSHQQPGGGQFRPSAVTWELRNINRDDIQRNYDSSSSTSSTSRQQQLQNRGGREGGVAAVRNYQQQQLPYYDDGHHYQAPPPSRYGGSAPPTPQHGGGGGGGYATPIEIMSGHKGGGVPKFGDWEGDSNYTQYFENSGGVKNKEKQPLQQPRQKQNNLMARPTNNEYHKQQPRSIPALQKPTFLPEVQRRVVSTPPKSPSYDHFSNNIAAKKKSPRCWPFRFSSK